MIGIDNFLSVYNITSLSDKVEKWDDRTIVKSVLRVNPINVDLKPLFQIQMCSPTVIQGFSEPLFGTWGCQFNSILDNNSFVDFYCSNAREYKQHVIRLITTCSFDHMTVM